MRLLAIGLLMAGGIVALHATSFTLDGPGTIGVTKARLFVPFIGATMDTSALGTFYNRQKVSGVDKTFQVTITGGTGSAWLGLHVLADGAYAPPPRDHGTPGDQFYFDYGDYVDRAWIQVETDSWDNPLRVAATRSKSSQGSNRGMCTSGVSGGGEGPCWIHFTYGQPFNLHITARSFISYALKREYAGEILDPWYQDQFTDFVSTSLSFTHVSLTGSTEWQLGANVVVRQIAPQANSLMLNNDGAETPEPATMGLLLGSGGVLLAIGRLRRAKGRSCV